MSNLYEQAFKLNLEDFKEDLDLGLDPEAEDGALDDQLDPGMVPDDLGAGPEGDIAEIADAMSRHSQDMHDKIHSWVAQMEEFSENLNGLGEDSIQSLLKNAVPDTVFDKIRSSEMKKISRVAMEVAALTEILKGYLASADDPKFKYV
tara:strand:- start:217 stop:660 length:444 start_codon:yes stop_codon:yes gene_type:complete